MPPKKTTKKLAAKRAKVVTNHEYDFDKNTEEIVNKKQAVCCDTAAPPTAQQIYDDGVRAGTNRAISEHPIASRLNHLEGLQCSLSSLKEEKDMKELQIKGLEDRIERCSDNIKRVKREISALLPDLL